MTRQELEDMLEWRLHNYLVKNDMKLRLMSQLEKAQAKIAVLKELILEVNNGSRS